MEIDHLISAITHRVKSNKDAVRFSPATSEEIAFCEHELSVSFPDELKQCYLEIGNGGFGPGYGITGLPGGHESSWGNLIQSTFELRKDTEVEEGWIPIIDFGCAEFLLVDCDNEGGIVALVDGNYHAEEYSFRSVLENWIVFKRPDLQTGGFRNE